MGRRWEVTEIQRRLADLLVIEKEWWRSYDRLAWAILQENGNNEALRVDRRKLKKIVDTARETGSRKSDGTEGRDVSLNFRELQALDTYLLRRGKNGLGPIFDKPTLIRLMAANERIAFLIGAKPQEHARTVVTSRWDVRSIIDIMHDLHKHSTNVVLDIEDVLLRSPGTGSGAGDAVVDFIDDKTQELLESPEPLSLVCIGSPRACHASEVVLAEMFDILPFQRPGTLANRKLPFYFVWSDQQCDELPSSFALRASDVLNRARITSDWKSVALKVTDPEKVFEVEPNDREWRNYGVIAAQRRPAGQIWVVVAGLSGPSTSAASKALAAMGGERLLGAVDRTGQVVWAVVEAEVKRDPELKGEDRVLIDHKLLSGPHGWAPPGKGQNIE